MINKYYNLPFGAQLLLWTSRIAIHGSCSSTPNKYELINMAYKKVGIENCSSLLKKVLLPLKNKPLFKLQQICKTDLIDSEINFINCLQEHKKKYIDNKFYLELWCLEDRASSFTNNCKNLANAFIFANLNINLHFNNHADQYNRNFNITNNTIH